MERITGPLAWGDAAEQEPEMEQSTEHPCVAPQSSNPAEMVGELGEAVNGASEK